MSRRILIYHKNDFFEKLEEETTLKQTRKFKNINEKLFLFLLEKLSLKDDEVLLIFFYGYIDDNNDSVIDYIKQKNIKKIYFFIEDVFRLLNPDNSTWLETYSIELYPEQVKSLELNIIKKILISTNIEFEIFHCEYNSQNFFKSYNFNLKYYDYFLSEMSLNYYKNTNFLFTQNFKYKISCFNLRPDWHRYFLSILLKDESNIFLTLNHRFTPEEILKNKALPLNRFNEEIKNKILEGQHAIKFKNLTWDGSAKDIKKFSYTDIPPSKQQQTMSQTRQSFVNVITETRFCSPMPNVSEKTLKPINVFRPFIMLGPPGNLKLLKDLGFQTFDLWWDESYDEILDHNKRFEKVYYLIKYILNKPNKELGKMLKQMTNTLQHNRENLKNLHKHFLEI